MIDWFAEIVTTGQVPPLSAEAVFAYFASIMSMVATPIIVGRLMRLARAETAFSFMLPLLVLLMACGSTVYLTVFLKVTNLTVLAPLLPIAFAAHAFSTRKTYLNRVPMTEGWVAGPISGPAAIFGLLTVSTLLLATLESELVTQAPIRWIPAPNGQDVEVVEARPGEFLRVRLRAEIRVSCRAKVYYIISHHGAAIARGDADVGYSPVGMADITVRAPVRLPADAPPGEHRLTINRTDFCSVDDGYTRPFEYPSMHATFTVGESRERVGLSAFRHLVSALNPARFLAPDP